MSDCATPKIRFETATALPLASAFDGGRITSGRRFLWLAKVDLRPINQKLTKVLEVCLMAEIGFEDDKIRRAILGLP